MKTDDYPTRTINEDDLTLSKAREYPVMLGRIYSEWDIALCYPLTPFTFKYQDNDTVVDMTRTDIPIVKNISSSTTMEIWMPTTPSGARFNASIYWEFEVTKPGGNVFMRSNPWHITYCHA